MSDPTEDSSKEIGLEEVESVNTAPNAASPPPNGVKRRGKPKRRDSSGTSTPESTSRPRKVPGRASSTATPSSSSSEPILDTESTESGSKASPIRRKRRVRRARAGTEPGEDDESESSFLVEMDDLGQSTDEEAPEGDEEMGFASSERGQGPCCCIRGIVDMLKLLSASWLHFALIVIPFPIIIHLADWHRGLLFVMAYISLFPLSSLMKVLSGATSKILPSRVFALTRIVIRNLLPLLVGAFAVHNSLDRMVQGLIMGLLIHRLFLCFGTSVLIAANLSKTRKIDDNFAKVASSFLYISMVLLILPSIFRLSSPDSGVLDILKISRWCAVFLFILLICLLFYTLRTETKFWDAADLPTNKPRIMIGTLIVTLAIGIVFSTTSSWLVINSSVWVAQNWGLGYTFIAGILIPIALNAADGIDYTRVAFTSRIKSATQDMMRSSLEVCLYLAPLLIVAAWISGKSIGLNFFGLVSASGVLATINIAFMFSTLKITWFQGATMMVAYLLFTVCYFLQSE